MTAINLINNNICRKFHLNKINWLHKTFKQRYNLTFMTKLFVYQTQTFSDTEGHSHNTICTGNSIETADEVWQVIKNRQIMLHNNDELFWVNQLSNSQGSFKSLFHIQVTGGFIEHETIKSHFNIYKSVLLTKSLSSCYTCKT